MKKSAFTMLELVFVIVIIGIISAMIIPRLDRDNRFEAATQVLNHVKYTQHLAMTEDVFNDGDPDTGAGTGWFKQRWEIQFFGCGGYAVHKDMAQNGGNAANADAALDPQTRKFLWVDAVCTMPMATTNYEKMNLAGYFDVKDITFAGCNNVQQISFDTLGRPYSSNNINSVLKQNCDITLSFNTGANEVIRIHPETGYACILNTAGANCI